jgi:hypothetical protein
MYTQRQKTVVYLKVIYTLLGLCITNEMYIVIEKVFLSLCIQQYLSCKATPTKCTFELGFET